MAPVEAFIKYEGAKQSQTRCNNEEPTTDMVFVGYESEFDCNHLN
jgi:hypothetical protein